MNASWHTHRRGFFARLLGTVAAGTVAATNQVQAQTAGPDAWIGQVRGSHRTLFDFPQHKNGVPLLHILNYLNTYREAYDAVAGQVGAVGTFYGIGPQSSIALGFNDAAWARYQLGEYSGMKDAAGRPYTRNVFLRPTADDLHLLMAAMQTPTIPMFAGAMPALGIASLQQMGTTFLMCANALGAWCAELEARGKGKAADVERDLRASLIPGVIIVPAMVIAIEASQAAGIRYNRQ